MSFAAARGQAIVGAAKTFAIVEKDDHFGVLGACHCMGFGPSITVASSSHGALFPLFGVFAKLPSSEGCLEHFESCFVGTTFVKCSAASSLTPDRVAILYFKTFSLAKVTVVSSFDLLHLHSVNGFLGFDPDLH
jgi:hypothetical protein